jgi:hypothetical protein
MCDILKPKRVSETFKGKGLSTLRYVIGGRCDGHCKLAKLIIKHKLHSKLRSITPVVTKVHVILRSFAVLT